jgi:hypothetical protein
MLEVLHKDIFEGVRNNRYSINIQKLNHVVMNALLFNKIKALIQRIFDSFYKIDKIKTKGGKIKTLVRQKLIKSNKHKESENTLFQDMIEALDTSDIFALDESLDNVLFNIGVKIDKKHYQDFLLTSFTKNNSFALSLNKDEKEVYKMSNNIETKCLSDTIEDLKVRYAKSRIRSKNIYVCEDRNTGEITVEYKLKSLFNLLDEKGITKLMTNVNSKDYSNIDVFVNYYRTCLNYNIYKTKI